MEPDDLEGRTKQFALQVLKLVAVLPNNVVGKTIAERLTHEATNAAANYRASCRIGSEGTATARRGIVEEQIDQSVYWLQLIVEGELLRKEKVQPLLHEAIELSELVSALRAPVNRERNLASFRLPVEGIHLRTSNET